MLLWLVLLSSLCVQLAVAGPSPAEQRESESVLLSPGEVFERVSPLVFVLEVLDDQGSLVAQGSAVVVAVKPRFQEPRTQDEFHSYIGDLLRKKRTGEPVRRTVLVASKHVIAEGDSYRLRKGSSTWKATAIALHPDVDLCLLAIDNLEVSPPSRRPSGTIEIGERVYAVGAPRGFELTLSEGLVSGLREDPLGLPLVQTTAAISPGSSGGGLFDSRGQLIGITTYSVTESQNLNFALPIEPIVSLEIQLGTHPDVGTARAWVAIGDEIIDRARPHEMLSDWNDPQVIMRAREINRIFRAAQRKAAKAYQKALLLTLSDVEVLLKLGQLYADLGERERMIQTYEKALRIRPDDVQCWTSMARGYKRLDDRENAIRAYKHALSLRPNDVGLWTDLARAYSFRQRKLAMHALREAERLGPDAIGWWSIGLEYQVLGEYKLARKAFETATELDPGNSTYLFSLGQLHVLRGKFSDARKVYERLKVIDPSAARRLAESLR